MNNTKWEELRLAMYGLRSMSPQWRTKDVENGYLSTWNGDWYYHFKDGGYKSIEWLEIRVTSPEQDSAVLRELKFIYVPGYRTEYGFKIFGYARDREVLEYI